MIIYSDEDDYDRRPQRRRYEEPLAVKLRKQLLSIAESPLKRVEDEILSIARALVAHASDPEVRESFCSLAMQLVAEQPFKIPFVAAVVLGLNALEPEPAAGSEAQGLVAEVLRRAARETDRAVRRGEWRAVKLYLKFLAGVQGCLAGEGVFPVLEDMLAKAVDLQTENNEEVSLVLCGDRRG